MYVTKGTEISSNVRMLLESNPFKQRLDDLSTKRESHESNIANHKSSIASYKRDLHNQLLGLNIEEQKYKKLEREIKVAQKILEQSTNEFNCDFLNVEVMEKFFKSCGLKFINLSIKQSGSEATMQWIRPSKLIGALPTPPMIIEFYYSMKKGVLTLNETRSFCPVSSSSGYTHPHINGSNICMGNYYEVLHSTGGSVLLEGYQDQVLLMDQMLSTYNPDSPFRGIDEIMSSMIRGMSIHKSNTIGIDNYSTFTFKHSELSTSSSEYKVVDLLTRELFEEWYVELSKVSPSGIVDDLLARLSTLESENFTDDYDYLTRLESEIESMLPNLALSCVSDYSAYSDDDDEGIYEDDFYSVIEVWKKELVKYLTSEDCKNVPSLFAKLPDLEELFNHVPAPDVSELSTPAPQPISYEQIPF